MRVALAEGEDEGEDEEGLDHLLEGALGVVGGDQVREADQEGRGGAARSGGWSAKAARAVRGARIATAIVRPLKPWTMPMPRPLLRATTIACGPSG